MSWKQYGERDWRSGYEDSLELGRFPITADYSVSLEGLKKNGLVHDSSSYGELTEKNFPYTPSRNVVETEFVLLKTTRHFQRLYSKPRDLFDLFNVRFDYEYVDYEEVLKVNGLEPPGFPHLVAITRQYKDHHAFKGLGGYSPDANRCHVIAAVIRTEVAGSVFNDLTTPYAGWTRERGAHIGVSDFYKLPRGYGCWWIGVPKRD